ncbi:hypothetical protein CJ030_MR1G028908 [Morella rubra]|uniref:PB1 domain-containing protein n=1 Tax=Morella rubra TaxID=262757 RepID=A0A6A1WR41_9ROSI|nr:hypothetical protein CJ030_MR1G028908 [Morella rubra]
MTSHHASELDAGTTDSVASSPRSDHHPHGSYDQHPRVRFMCSFGGKILPRPHDNQLRYVGGDTRIVAVHRSTNFSTVLSKLSKLSGALPKPEYNSASSFTFFHLSGFNSNEFSLCTGTTDITIKYQLPSEDLDALISVTTDEDVENMMDEYDRLAHNQNPRSARLRLFLFPKGDDSRTSSISSILDGSASRDQWFLDAINGGGAAPGSGIERGRSEASSIVSELPDYLFGLDNAEETQPRDPKIKSRYMLGDNVSNSDPGSPAPVVPSPFCSSSSAPCVPPIPNLPPVKTKSYNPEAKENQTDGFAETGEPPLSHSTGFPGNPMLHYIPDSSYSLQPAPVYYVPSAVPPGNVPVQPISIRASYLQQYSAVPGQVPVSYHHHVSGLGQMYGGAGGMRPVAAAYEPYDMTARVVPDGVNQQVFYGVRNPGMVPMYNMVGPGGEDSQGIVSDVKTVRPSQ